MRADGENASPWQPGRSSGSVQQRTCRGTAGLATHGSAATAAWLAWCTAWQCMRMQHMQAACRRAPPGAVQGGRRRRPAGGGALQAALAACSRCPATVAVGGGPCTAGLPGATVGLGRPQVQPGWRRRGIPPSPPSAARRPACLPIQSALPAWRPLGRVEGGRRGGRPCRRRPNKAGGRRQGGAAACLRPQPPGKGRSSYGSGAGCSPWATAS